MNASGPHHRPPTGADADRRRAAALAGHTADLTAAQRFATDPDGAVRATALGALARIGALDSAIPTAASDPDAGVRRRLAEELGRRGRPTHAPDEVTEVLLKLLDDADPLTVEAAAWALGEVAGADEGGLADAVDLTGGGTGGGGERGEPVEVRQPVDPRVVPALTTTAAHEDALVREAAVAALGAIGDPAGLGAILAGTTDRPAVRRRAVLALAPFLGQPGVAEALDRALGDRDWQVRQAAELLGARDDPPSTAAD